MCRVTADSVFDAIPENDVDGKCLDGDKRERFQTPVWQIKDGHLAVVFKTGDGELQKFIY